MSQHAHGGEAGRVALTPGESTDPGMLHARADGLLRGATRTVKAEQTAWVDTARTAQMHRHTFRRARAAWAQNG
eukprot:15468294-Alexandrium_andersonii.AAC.1